jgi:hypothetical protein
LAVSRWHLLSGQQKIEKVSEYLPTIQRSPFEERGRNDQGLRDSGWFAFGGYLMILLSLNQFAKMRAWFVKRPWWCMLGLGFFVWIICGSVIPSLVLGGIGLGVAVDSYWIVTSRLRRTGTRGLPSL